MKLYWVREVFKTQSRRRGRHQLPGDYTKAQLEALQDMLNIANWFMDVKIVSSTQKQAGKE